MTDYRLALQRTIGSCDFGAAPTGGPSGQTPSEPAFNPEKYADSVLVSYFRLSNLGFHVEAFNVSKMPVSLHWDKAQVAVNGSGYVPLTARFFRANGELLARGTAERGVSLRASVINPGKSSLFDIFTAPKLEVKVGDTLGLKLPIMGESINCEYEFLFSIRDQAERQSWY